MDLNISGWTKATIDRVVKLARECGWAAWYRPYLAGPNGWQPHIHMIRIGDKTASKLAQAQVAAYYRGENGLKNRDRDNGPIVTGTNGKPRPNWAESRHNTQANMALAA